MLLSLVQMNCCEAISLQMWIHKENHWDPKWKSERSFLALSYQYVICVIIFIIKIIANVYSVLIVCQVLC